MQETLIRVYKNPNDYAKEAHKLSQAGWTVASTANQQPRSGCGRILALGLFAAVFKPKPIIVVTYVRDGGEA